MYPLKEKAELEKRVKETLWTGTRRANLKPDPMKENLGTGTEQDPINLDKKAEDDLSYLRIPLAIVLAADDEVLTRAERLAAALADEAVRVEMLLPDDRRLVANGVSASRAVACHDSNR